MSYVVLHNGSKKMMSYTEVKHLEAVLLCEVQPTDSAEEELVTQIVSIELEGIEPKGYARFKEMGEQFKKRGLRPKGFQAGNLY